MREPELLRLAFEDGTSGYAFGNADIRGAMADSWDSANSEVTGDIEWLVDDLDDDLEPEESQLITVDVRTLVELLRMARIGQEYAGCSVCRRVTLV